MINCRICGSAELDSPIMAPETMFGTGEEFAYQRCTRCGCLQIIDPPSDMGPYYPASYYSFAAPAPGALEGIKTRVRGILAQHGPTWLFAGQEWWEKGDRKSLRDARVSRSDRILDLGCGTGALIASLRDIGFRNVLGADPFIECDILHKNGARVLKRTTAGIEGQFDVIMMHHSLEHIWNQQLIIGEIARLLVSGGRCIIRIPVIDSWAWEEYGPKWVQLDPPRHFYLHTRASLAYLMRSFGFEISAIVDDSSAYQILGSEKVRRGHPVVTPGRPAYAGFLPAGLIATAPRRARQLNSSGRGDSIAVHARLSAPAATAA